MGYIKIQNPYTLQSIKTIERRQELFASVNLVRPWTLEFYERYIRIERPAIFTNPISNTVRFIAFDPCPAFVIVQNSEGIKFRCPREETYLYTDGDGGEEITG